MGLARLRAFLSRHRRIALDTNVFICCFEGNVDFSEMSCAVFAWLERPNHSAVTSTLTMTEILVHPYRNANERLVNRYYGLLTALPNLEWVAPDLAITDLAARIRAEHNLKTVDALQIATGIRSGATALVTNDRPLSRVSGIEVAVLSALGAVN